MSQTVSPASPPPPARVRPATHSLSPRFWFAAGSLLVLLLYALLPPARTFLGVQDHGRWFLDSYAVLASSDAAPLGIDPSAPNPLDIFHRSHKYSDWWFVLGKMGFTRDDNFLVGGAWVLAFLAAVFLTVRPATRRETLWLVLLMASPPVLLGVIRANNDLVIFAVLALVLWSVQSSSGPRIALTIALLVLATGLKFYPVVAVAIFLLVPEPRRMLAALVLGTIATGGLLATMFAQVMRGTFHIEPEIFTFGGRIALMDFGLPEKIASLAVIPVLAVLAVVALRMRWTMGIAPAAEPGVADTPAARGSALLAASLLVACFVSGINHGYRWIFALWAAPWCWATRDRNPASRLAVWLLPICLWHDGLLVLATGLFFPHLQQDQYDRILVVWRWITEPVTWALMVIFAAGMLELALARWREIRFGFGPGKSPESSAT